jgi:pimeloyl-ACP methyl ester carboxylesterase
MAAAAVFATGLTLPSPVLAQPAAPAVHATPGKGFVAGHVEVRGFSIRYAEAGPRNAPTIVSLPGSAGLEMSTAKDQLARTFHVIELQPPGWGDSPELTRPMEQSELGEILGEAANTLVRGRYHLLGTSMGGANALYLTARFPDRVKSLTLEGSMAPARLADLGTPMIYRDQVRQMLAAGGPPGGYPAPPAHPNKPWATPEFTRAQMAARFRMMQWVQADTGAPPLFEKVRASNVPILAMVGDHDAILKLSLQQYYVETLPKARFVVVPGGEHDLQNTQPEFFAREVAAHVRRTDH